MFPSYRYYLGTNIVLIFSTFFAVLFTTSFAQNATNRQDSKFQEKIAQSNSTPKNTTYFFIPKAQKNLWTHNSTTYNCTNRRYKCSGPGLFADPNDHTIFFMCKWNIRRKSWRAICFQCNRKFGKCFSNELQACVPCNVVQGTGRVKIREIISPTSSYTCDGYQTFPCSQLGIGLHEHPGDRSIAVRCSNDTWMGKGEWVGGCMTCSKINTTCFVGGIEQCVENCMDGKLYPYNCAHFDLKEDQPCTLKGKFPAPFDNTTYFQCVSIMNGMGRMMPKCHQCPDNSYFHPYKKKCLNPEGVEMEEHEFDIQVRELYENILTDEKEVGDEGEVSSVGSPPGGYDCGPYHEHLFPCNRAGLFAYPSDTSVYFSCLPLISGGFAAACHTCNKLYNTCFEDRQGACVTVAGNRPCNTTNLQDLEGKGTKWSSMTYSCEGYSNESFPCGSYASGYYAMPGDPSVYVQCEDLDGDGVPEFISCHNCDYGCYDGYLGRCVNYCGNGRKHFNAQQPSKRLRNWDARLFTFARNDSMSRLNHAVIPKSLKMHNLTYNCSRVKFTCEKLGVFVNPIDPSVWFECSKGVRSNDWGIKCSACPNSTCFDVKVRACVDRCKWIGVDRGPALCSDYWHPVCDFLGIV